MSPKITNSHSIEHRSANGTIFTCARADLKADIVYHSEWPIDLPKLMQDVAEFATWHRSCIWDQLNGFQGYDTIRFKQSVEPGVIQPWAGGECPVPDDTMVMYLMGNDTEFNGPMRAGDLAWHWVKYLTECNAHITAFKVMP